ncbi:PREDICTED: PRA1 family protein G2-like [Nelumbo nucifera]|uniref:PRA1 family protein n=2 Tax=Nelumbo nucifera TaxID=4432 RepID=A0A822XUU7_NELNU|nr:PREDICTED: PRA1 family protein G2-like [Nelumbo nucifera]DAD23752.1 TPA_asm: hypothetical protein HUJ06_025215 [Nelumbo nucifera]
MQPQIPSSATATYTTIPISGNDVISRSLHNLFSFISQRRPWPEFISPDTFNRPHSLAHAGDRLRKNAVHFRLNYALLVLTCALLSLIGTPLYLLLIAAIFGLWLVLYLFREDPLFLWGHHVGDRAVLVGLVLVSVVAIWFTGVAGNMIMGIGTGLVISAVHGVFRNPDGLFLDENEAMSQGLIRPGSSPSSDRWDHMLRP